MSDPMRSVLRVEYDWKPLIGPNNTRFLYPGRPADFISSAEDRPGVYRWAFFSPDPGAASEPRKVLIGETESLLRRIKEYVKPTTPTEQKWCDSFHKDILNGWKIELHLLCIHDLFLNEQRAHKDLLHDPFWRILIESWMVVIHPRGSCEVLNKGKNLKLKQAEAKVRKAERLLAQAQRLTASRVP